MPIQVHACLKSEKFKNIEARKRLGIRKQSVPDGNVYLALVLYPMILTHVYVRGRIARPQPSRLISEKAGMIVLGSFKNRMNSNIKTKVVDMD